METRSMSGRISDWIAEHRYPLLAAAGVTIVVVLALPKVLADFPGTARPQGAGYDMGAWEQ